MAHPNIHIQGTPTHTHTYHNLTVGERQTRLGAQAVHQLTRFSSVPAGGKAKSLIHWMQKTADIGRGGQHCVHASITLAAKLREQHQGRHPGMQSSNECRKQALCSAVCLQKVQALSSWYIVCRAHVFEVRVVSLITRWVALPH